MATTEKMVIRQAKTVHLRLTRTRTYSPKADSWEGSWGYMRGPMLLPKSAAGDCISRMIGLLACTSGPGSMHSPQQISKTVPGWMCRSSLGQPTASPAINGWFIGRNFFSLFVLARRYSSIEVLENNSRIRESHIFCATARWTCESRNLRYTTLQSSIPLKASRVCFFVDKATVADSAGGLKAVS